MILVVSCLKFYSFQHKTTLYVIIHTHTHTHIYTEEFLAALQHAENVQQLFCKIVCSLLMGQ